MTADVRLGAISIDTTDPAGLAAFYRDLLDLEIMFESESFVALKGGGVLITTQQVDDHQAPSWPGGNVPKQMHLELAVDDLDATEAKALGLGASKPDAQEPNDIFRVLLDPAGHPFCLTTLVPEV